MFRFFLGLGEVGFLSPGIQELNQTILRELLLLVRCKTFCSLGRMNPQPPKFRLKARTKSQSGQQSLQRRHFAALHSSKHAGCVARVCRNTKTCDHIAENSICMTDDDGDEEDDDDSGRHHMPSTASSASCCIVIKITGIVIGTLVLLFSGPAAINVLKVQLTP